MTKRIVCYSGGHTSALVAIEVVRRYGKEPVLLVNHDLHPTVEAADIKRFKREVAEYLGLPITYVNMPGWDTKDQFDVVIEAGAFKVGTGTALCTNRLKTAPFMEWLAREFPVPESGVSDACVIYYGFHAGETDRIQRRASILGAQGYRTDFPLALWPERTIRSTTEVGIEPPCTYGVFTHGNCAGCLKAGKQHWYVVYCLRRDLWEKGKQAEAEIGFSIHGDAYLEDLEPLFEQMRRAGIPADENIPQQRFWASAKRAVKGTSLFELEEQRKPCECVF